MMLNILDMLGFKSSNWDLIKRNLSITFWGVNSGSFVILIFSFFSLFCFLPKRSLTILRNKSGEIKTNGNLGQN